MTQQFKTEDLKIFFTGKLYQNLHEIMEKLEQESNSSVATDVIVSALSVNLGHIVGQLEPKQRRKALRSVKKIMDQQVTELSKFAEIERHGTIGHA